MAGYFTNRHGSITITAGAKSYTFDDVGDFSASPIVENNSDVVVVRHRKAIKAVEYGDEVEQSGTFTATVPREDFTDAAASRLFDAIRAAGFLAGGTNQNYNAVDSPFLWSMAVTYTDGTTTGSVTFPRTRLSGSFEESGDVVVCSISWTSYGEPVFV